MRRRVLIFLACLAATAGCRSPQPAVVSPAPAAPPRAESLPKTIAETLQLRGDSARYSKALQNLIHAADATTARQARALYAMSRAAEGDHQGSIALLENAAADSPLLAPVLLVELARSRAATGDFRGALDAARSVIDSYPDSGAATEARLIAPALALRNGDPFAAASLLDAALSVSIDPFSETLLIALADDLEAQHRDDLALQVRLRLIERYPRGRHFEETFPRVILPEGAASPFDTMTVSQMATLAERFGEAGHADEGLELVRLLRKRDAKGANAERVRIATARLLFRLRRYDELLTFRLDPKSQYFAELQLMRARAYWRLDRDEEFLQIVSAMIRKPQTPDADVEARELLARYHAGRPDEHDKAATIFGALVARGAAGADGEHLWGQSWQLLPAGRDHGRHGVPDPRPGA